MSDTMPELREVRVDCNDEKVQIAGRALAEELLKKFGEPMAIGATVVAVEELLTAVMHTSTPYPEHNIKYVRELLQALLDRVMSHEDCAHHNKVKLVVH